MRFKGGDMERIINQEELDLIRHKKHLIIDQGTIYMPKEFKFKDEAIKTARVITEEERIERGIPTINEFHKKVAQHGDFNFFKANAKGFTDYFLGLAKENEDLKKELKKYKRAGATPTQLQRAYQERYKYSRRRKQL